MIIVYSFCESYKMNSMNFGKGTLKIFGMMNLK